MPSFAILIDYENFTCPPEGLQQFLADFSKRGTVIVKRAYADWVRCAAFRQPLLANQVEMIELPNASKGKNSADIRLVVDAMELVFTKPYIDTYVVASADADFLPLLSRLREYNKQTIVVSRTQNTHAYMRTHCDEFVNGEVYLTSKRKSASPKTTSAASTLTIAPKNPAATTTIEPTGEQRIRIQESMTTVGQAYGFDRSFDLAMLGSALKTANPDLEWKDYGFKSLKSMVADLVSRGFLRIELTRGATDRIHLIRPIVCNPTISEVGENNAVPDGCPTVENEVKILELADLVRNLDLNRVRLDAFRKTLLQSRPELLASIDCDEDFLKLLQSLEAHDGIDLTYEPFQKTYYVSSVRARPKMSQPTMEEDEIGTNIEEERNQWSQPRLF